MAQHTTGQTPDTQEQEPQVAGTQTQDPQAQGEAKPDGEATAESVGRSTAMMSGLVIVSRVTGFFRTWSQAYAVGVTMLASCYTIANNLPNLLYELVMGGMLVTAFLPVYMSVKKRLGRDGANAYASNLFSFIVLIMGGLSLLSIVFAAPVVWTQTFSATSDFDFDLSVYFFRFFAIEIMLYALSTVVSGILNAEREYFWSSAAPIFNNFVTIASFLLYAALANSNPGLALLILALGNPLGVAAQLLVQMPALRRQGVRLRWRIDTHDPAIRETLSIGVPSLVCTVVMFVSSSVQTSCEMQASVSGSSVAYYARIWYTLPHSILCIPITTAMFTELSDRYAEHDLTGYRRGIARGTSQIIFMLVPMMMFLMVFSVPLITVMAGRSFSAGEIDLTAQFLVMLSISLPFYGVYTYLQKICSSMRSMMLFAGASVAAGAAEVVFLMAATPVWGLMVPAFSHTIFYLIVDVVAFAQLHHRIGGVGLRSMAKATVRSALLGIAGSAVAWFILSLLNRVAGPTDGSLLKALVYCVLGGIPALLVTYGGAILLKVPEAAAIRRIAGRFVPALRGEPRRGPAGRVRASGSDPDSALGPRVPALGLGLGQVCCALGEVCCAQKLNRPGL